jgi:hypothetical protein
MFLNHPLPWVLAALLFAGCSAQPVSHAAPAPVSGSTTPTAEKLDEPKIPPSADRRVLQTLSDNLDQDAAEEQIILLQNKTNLSLPVIIQIADYDQARKTYYLAWEGKALAAASQPLTLSLDDLVGDHQKEIVIQGLDETGHPTLDVFRQTPPSGGLGLAYKAVFSKGSKGTIQIDHPQRPEAYGQGQNSDVSDPVILDEPDPTSKNPAATVRTTYNWLFQKGEYVATGVEKYLRNLTGDSALEKVFTGDNATLQSYLEGPWVRAVTDKSGLLLLFFDPKGREITFATADAQEVYQWEVSSRASRSSLYIMGSNSLINLIKLQMSVAITAADTLEVNAQDNPGWSGTYKKLDPSAALVLARQGTGALAQEKPPVGLYRNDKGDEFDFQVPEVRLKLAGVSMVGSMAVYPLGSVTILQVKVASRPGTPAFSRAYSLVAKEEASTSRIVKTLRLQSGTLTAKGWVSDQSDPLRLEQVEGNAANSSR